MFDNPHVLTSREIAELLGVSTAQVRSWCKNGLLEATVLPTNSGKYGRVLVTSTDLLEFTKKHRFPKLVQKSIIEWEKNESLPWFMRRDKN